MVVVVGALVVVGATVVVVGASVLVVNGALVVVVLSAASSEGEHAATIARTHANVAVRFMIAPIREASS